MAGNFGAGNRIGTIDLANHSGAVVASKRDVIDLSSVQIVNGTMTFLADRAYQSVTSFTSGGVFELASHDNTLTDGAGTNIFALLTTAVSNDTIAGFDPGKDMLDFSGADHASGWSVGTTAASILASATLVAGSTVFALDRSDENVLKGVSHGNLTFANFIAQSFGPLEWFAP